MGMSLIFRLGWGWGHMSRGKMDELEHWWTEERQLERSGALVDSPG